MISQNTICILGAGASYPYGFPTGEGLRDDICKNFEDRIVSLFNKDPISKTRDVLPLAKAAQKFVKTFHDSTTPSIDLFLARNIEFADIGKQAIVTSILAAEKNSSFREKMPEKFRSQD